MAVGVKLPESDTSQITTPDHTDFDFGGDFSVTAYIACADWTPTSDELAILSKFSTVTSQSLWLFRVLTGVLQVQISNGSANTSWNSSIATGVTNGEAQWVGFTYDESAGEVKFWLGGSSATPSWSQLGTTISQTPITSSTTSTTKVSFGRWGSNSGGDYGTTMTIYEGAIYSGIGANTAPGQGTLVAEFSAPHAGTRYRDSTGKVWTLNGSAYSTVITA